MLYTTYKIINNLNGKIYIGCHQTKDIDDGYMGSGKLIKRAINKDGIENFTKEIIGTFDSVDQMFIEEQNLISKLDPDYNIHSGGNGGWNYVNETGKNNNTKTKKQKEVIYKKISKKLTGRKPHPNSMRALIESHKNKAPEDYMTFLGKTHTEETKKKIGLANSKHQKGKGNSQYGTMWITDGTNNQKIKKTDTIPGGWNRGRINYRAPLPS